MQTGSVGSIHEYWDGTEAAEAVITTTLLSDLNQPYSCEQWSNLAPGEGGTIVHDTNYDFFNLYNSDSGFPSAVWIDHEMRVHYKSNSTGYYLVNLKIEQMLEDCGKCIVDDEVVSVSGQQDCCEIYGGTYSTDNNSLPELDVHSCTGSVSTWINICQGCSEGLEFDCNFECGGSAEEDCAGICNGDAEEDCAGICGGNSYYDDCGVCDMYSDNDNNSCVQDCLGEWSGTAEYDCTETCNGSAVTDVNGTCCELWFQDCAGVCYGPTVEDCSGECGGSLVVDECDVCGGDGTSCIMLGDINLDGVLNVLDVVLLVNMIVGSVEENSAGDINDDGLYNVLDVVQLVNIIVAS